MRIIADGLEFPEGPVALEDGSFLVVEILGQRLTRIDASGRKETVATIKGGPNGAAIGPDGACYVCNNGGFRWHMDAEGPRPVGQSEDYETGSIERVDLASGEVTRLYSRTELNGLRGPNDLVFDRHGGFWFTDAGKSRERDFDRGGVYYAHVDGSTIREVVFPMNTPNGIALSPDESKLYVAETLTGRLWSFDVAGPGELRHRPWPSLNGGTLLTACPDLVGFDSMAVDGDGNICVASLFKGGITVVSPAGTIIDHVPMPDRYTTNICFGGPELRSAYITLAQSGLLVEIPWRCPGLPLNWLNH